jgi:hypothetical protein
MHNDSGSGSGSHQIHIHVRTLRNRPETVGLLHSIVMVLVQVPPVKYALVAKTSIVSDDPVVSTSTGKYVFLKSYSDQRWKTRALVAWPLLSDRQARTAMVVCPVSLLWFSAIYREVFPMCRRRCGYDKEGRFPMNDTALDANHNEEGCSFVHHRELPQQVCRFVTTGVFRLSRRLLFEQHLDQGSYIILIDDAARVSAIDASGNSTTTTRENIYSLGRAASFCCLPCPCWQRKPSVVL